MYMCTAYTNSGFIFAVNDNKNNESQELASDAVGNWQLYFFRAGDQLLPPSSADCDFLCHFLFQLLGKPLGWVSDTDGFIRWQYLVDVSTKPFETLDIISWCTASCWDWNPLPEDTRWGTQAQDKQTLPWWQWHHHLFCTSSLTWCRQLPGSGKTKEADTSGSWKSFPPWHSCGFSSVSKIWLQVPDCH